MNQRTFLVTSAGAVVMAALIAATPLAAQSSTAAAKPDPKAAAKSSAGSDAPFALQDAVGRSGPSGHLDQRRYLGRAVRAA